MRPHAQLKLGFYPTPGEVVELIGQHLQLDGALFLHVLDPTAGEGEALQKLADLLRQKDAYVTTTGIELHRQRFKKLKQRVDRAFSGDARNYRAEGFHLLFLNPPYDYSPHHPSKRLEVEFFEHYRDAVVPGGVLVLIIPEPRLTAFEPFLVPHYRVERIVRFPPEHFAAFKQVVLFARRRTEPLEARETLPAVLGPEEWARPWSVPLPDKPSEGRIQPVLPPNLRELAEASPLWEEAASSLESLGNLRPLTPPSEGHLALLVAAGALRSTPIQTPEGPCLVLGYTVKRTVSVETDESTVETEVYEPRLRAWWPHLGRMEDLKP